MMARPVFGVDRDEGAWAAPVMEMPEPVEPIHHVPGYLQDDGYAQFQGRGGLWHRWSYFDAPYIRARCGARRKYIDAATRVTGTPTCPKAECQP